MARQYTGAGTRFQGPIFLRERGVDAATEAVSEVWTPTKLDFKFWEDFFPDFNLTGSPLALYDQSASGTPTGAVETNGVGGQYKMTLAATNELEVYGFTFDNNLIVDSAKPFYFEARWKVPTIAANESVVVGLGSDAHTVLDDVTRNLWFRVDGDMDLLVEQDDTSTDTDDYDTGIDLSAATFVITAIERDAMGNIRYSYWEGDGSRRSEVHKLSGSGFSGNLQPLALVRKASGTTQPYLTLDYLALIGRRA